jgi:beta-galactosidase
VPEKAKEVFLNLTYKTKSRFGLLQAGQEVAWEQLTVKEGTIKPMVLSQGKQPLEYSETAGQLTINGDFTQVVFDKSTGYLKQITHHGLNLIKDGESLRPNFWRGPTDNDFGANRQNKLVAWKKSTKKQELTAFTTGSRNNNLLVTATYALSEVSAFTYDGI